MTTATLLARAPSTWSSCNAFASTSRIRLDASASASSFSTSAVRWKPQVGVQARTHYDVLGVPNTASKTEIKMEYFKLSKLYHPDANIDDPDSVAKFHVVSEAYAVLNNDDKRKAYDAKLARPPPKPKLAPGARRRDTARTRAGAAQSKDAYLSGLRAYEQQQRRQNEVPASAYAYERRKRAPPPKRIDVKKEEMKTQKMKEEVKEAMDRMPKETLADVARRVKEHIAQRRAAGDSPGDILKGVWEFVKSMPRDAPKGEPKLDTREAATEPEPDVNAGEAPADDVEYTIPEHYRLLIKLSAICLAWFIFVEGVIKAGPHRRREPPQSQADDS